MIIPSLLAEFVFSFLTVDWVIAMGVVAAVVAVAGGRVAAGLDGGRVANVVFCADGWAAGVVWATDDVLAVGQEYNLSSIRF